MSDVKTQGPKQIAVGLIILRLVILQESVVWRWTWAEGCALEGSFTAAEGWQELTRGTVTPSCALPASSELSAALWSWSRLL